MNQIKFTFLVSFILVLIFLCSCRQNQIKNTTSYVISPCEEVSKEVMLSKFLQKPNYIQLETKNESIIGFINKIIISDSVVYIMDSYFSNGLFAFDYEGRFLGKIASKGNGPGEFIDIMDFNIVNGNIEILANRTKLMQFDKDFNFVQKNKLPFLSSNYYKNLQDEYVFISSGDNKSREKIFVTDSNFVKTRSFMGSNMPEIPITGLRNYYGFGDDYIVYFPFDNYLKSYRKETLSNTILVDFPSNYVLSKEEIKRLNKINRNNRPKIAKSKAYFILNCILDKNLDIIFYSDKDNERYYSFSKKKNAIKTISTNVKDLVNDVDLTSILPTLCSKYGNNVLGVLSPSELSQKDIQV